MEQYIKFLIEQYKNARGYKKVNPNSVEFKNDFKNWLKKNKDNGINYASLLFSLGIDFTTKKSVEIDKGNLDSIVLPYDTTIISPYIRNDMNRQNVFDNKLVIKGYYPMRKEFDINFYRLMTQNPYSDFETKDYIKWKNIHEYTDYDIVLGVYGNLYDFDKEDKIRKLEIFKNYLTQEFIESYDIVNDTYYYLIASKPKKKKKI